MNKQLIKSRFSKSLHTYEQQADVQKLIAQTLARKAGEYLPTSCESLLEIGCGTGFLTRELLQQVSVRKLWLNDLVDELADRLSELAEGLSRHTQLQFIPGDAELIPFPSSVNGVVSASTLQWMSDLPVFFRKVSDAMQSDGIFVFNTFGSNNFQEIRTLLGSGLNYPDSLKLQKMLTVSFEILESWEETHTQSFDSPREVLRHLQETGVTATDCSFNWNKSKLQIFEKEYRQQFAKDGKVTLTWQVLYFICRKI